MTDIRVIQVNDNIGLQLSEDVGRILSHADALALADAIYRAAGKLPDTGNAEAKRWRPLPDAYVWNDSELIFTKNQGTIVRLKNGIQRIIISRPIRDDQLEEDSLSSIGLPSNLQIFELVE